MKCLGVCFLGYALAGCSGVTEEPDSTTTSETAQAHSSADDVRSRGLRVYEPNPSQPPRLTALAPDLGGAFACRRDQGDPQSTAERDLSGYMWADPAMTNAKCRNTCGQQAFVFSGTQYGSYCFCGPTYGKSGPATNCDMSCSGRPGEICGGAWANSISLTGAEPAIPGPPANGAQCSLVVRWSAADPNRNFVQTYRHVEVQRWEVTGPPIPNGKGYLIPFMWSTTGAGYMREEINAVVVRESRWGVSGVHSGTYQQVLVRFDSWDVSQTDPPFSIPNGIVEVQTIGGSSATQVIATAPALELDYSGMGTNGKTNLAHVGSASGSIAYRRPPGAFGNAGCQASIKLGNP